MMWKWTLKFIITTTLLLATYVAMRFFMFSGDPENTLTHTQQFQKNYKIYSLVSPSKLSFANEATPLHLIDIRERLDRELLVNTYWQSQTLLFLKRANKYFPTIEKILAENGVPNDFKYLALIESGLENVVSPAGATGFWQIMKGTGKDFGLEINSVVDERYHLEKSTQFACEYLKEAYNKFGSWTMAAASYNMGMNGLETQLKRQKVNNYYDLLLSTETARYVFRILAVKQILTHAKDYGFNARPEDLYKMPNLKEVVLNQPVEDLALFAAQQGSNYKILKTFNPWLRQDYLKPVLGKTYIVKLPNDTEAGWAPHQAPVTDSSSFPFTLSE